MNRIRWLQRVVLLLTIAVSFGAGVMLSPHAAVIAEDLVARLTATEQIFARVYEDVSPSVVAIVVEQRVGTEFVPYSSGSGFVLDEEGHIATNYHVVDGADRIVMNFYDGTIVEGDVIGLDADADIAVVRVDLPPERLQPVTFANSDEIVIGQRALAIGSPFGQRWTLTSGIISALDRSIEGLSNYNTGAVIQTDAPINPGNSGGPLMNLQGEVIGVNTQIISEDRANSGIGFAVPSNLVQRVVDELIDSGEVNYSYLGIRGTDVELDDILRLNLPNNTRGVVIRRVEPGEPADLAGLEFEDIVISIDDRPILGFASLLGYLSINTAPNDVIVMKILRNGRLIDLEVTLGSRR